MRVKHINGGNYHKVLAYVSVQHQVHAVILVDDKIISVDISQLQAERELNGSEPMGSTPGGVSHDTRADGQNGSGATGSKGSSRRQAR